MAVQPMPRVRSWLLTFPAPLLLELRFVPTRWSPRWSIMDADLSPESYTSAREAANFIGSAQKTSSLQAMRLKLHACYSIPQVRYSRMVSLIRPGWSASVLWSTQGTKPLPDFLNASASTKHRHPVAPSRNTSIAQCLRKVLFVVIRLKSLDRTPLISRHV